MYVTENSGYVRTVKKKTNNRYCQFGMLARRYPSCTLRIFLKILLFCIFFMQMFEVAESRRRIGRRAGDVGASANSTSKAACNCTNSPTSENSTALQSARRATSGVDKNQSLQSESDVGCNCNEPPGPFAIFVSIVQVPSPILYSLQHTRNR